MKSRNSFILLLTFFTCPFLFGKGVGFNIGLSKPSFTDKDVAGAFKTLYKGTPLLTRLGADWIFYGDDRFLFALGGGIGYSKSLGRPGVKTTAFTSTKEDIRVETESQTSLTLLPLDMTFRGLLFFDGERRFGINGVLGFSNLLYEEVVLSDQSKEPRKYIRKSQGALNAEAGLFCNLTQFLPYDPSSLDFMGIRDVLLNPYFRYVQKLDGTGFLAKEGKMDLSRMEYGLSFIFQ
jgi:hypothetical protein